jgi:hypothetical protein
MPHNGLRRFFSRTHTWTNLDAGGPFCNSLQRPTGDSGAGPPSGPRSRPGGTAVATRSNGRLDDRPPRLPWHAWGLVVVLGLLAGCTDAEPAQLPVPPIPPRAPEPGAALLEGLLRRAQAWYGEPEFFWGECVDVADRLRADQLPTDPLDVLRGSIEVMERSNVIADGKHRIVAYLIPYEMRRRDDPTHPGEPMGHQAAIDLMVAQGKMRELDDKPFREPPKKKKSSELVIMPHAGGAEPAAEVRGRQPLEVDQRVILEQLGAEEVDTRSFDEAQPFPYRITNGVEARIVAIVGGGSADQRLVFVEVLESFWRGEKVWVRPDQINAQ